jgi:oligopeptide/dipeptide ABC transporter ATP-binding protein
VGVMYHGHLVEVGKAREVLARPRHPYTRALLDSLPDLQHRCFERPLNTVPGTPPTSGEEFSGCPFAPRCPLVESICHRSLPSPEAISEFHWAACVKAR